LHREEVFQLFAYLADAQFWDTGGQSARQVRRPAQTENPNEIKARSQHGRVGTALEQ
jgi:hypothetical protein